MEINEEKLWDLIPSLKKCNERKSMCKVILYIYWKEKSPSWEVLGGKNRKLKESKIWAKIR